VKRGSAEEKRSSAAAAVRGGGSARRAAALLPHFYNTFEEIDRAVDALPSLRFTN